MEAASRHGSIPAERYVYVTIDGFVPDCLQQRKLGAVDFKQTTRRATPRLIPGAMRKDTKAVRGRTLERPFSIHSHGRLSRSGMDWSGPSTGLISRESDAGSIPAPASMAEDLKDAIEQNAAGPKQATVDGVTVQQHSLADQIAADKHLAAKRAMRNPAKALVRVQIVPPGTV